MTLSANIQRVAFTALAIVLLALQLTGASYAQSRMAAGSATGDTIILCTPDGFQTVSVTSSGQPDGNDGIRDCSCPDCALSAQINWEKVAALLEFNAAYQFLPISVPITYSTKHVRLSSRLAACCIGARAPPAYL